MNSDLELFLKRYDASPSPIVDETIHPDDEMYTFVAAGMGVGKARMLYFRFGSDLTRTILQILNWKFAGRFDHVRFLEFACGYGRNVRHLVRVISKERIFVSDIQEPAVRFNIEQFGVQGRVSVHDPKDLDWPERFDFIVVPSLFSHLPEQTFAGWIKALYDLLTPDGILAFSVHADHLLPPGTVPDGGIHFLLESENSVLRKEEYGLSYVTEGFVRDQIRRATGHAKYSLTRRGFWNHQDFYILAKDDRFDPSSFRYDHGAIGHIERIELGVEGVLEIAGWAKKVGPAGNDGVMVRALLDGRQIAKCKPTEVRTDVADAFGDRVLRSGFTLRAQVATSSCRPENLLAVEVLDSERSNYIHVLPLCDSLSAEHRTHIGSASKARGVSRLIRRVLGRVA
jgi:SAM-dependent methyltransferase